MRSRAPLEQRRPRLRREAPPVRRRLPPRQLRSRSYGGAGGGVPSCGSSTRCRLQPYRSAPGRTRTTGQGAARRTSAAVLPSVCPGVAGAVCVHMTIRRAFISSAAPRIAAAGSPVRASTVAPRIAAGSSPSRSKLHRRQFALSHMDEPQHRSLDLSEDLATGSAPRACSEPSRGTRMVRLAHRLASSGWSSVGELQPEA